MQFEETGVVLGKDFADQAQTICHESIDFAVETTDLLVVIYDEHMVVLKNRICKTTPWMSCGFF